LLRAKPSWLTHVSIVAPEVPVVDQRSAWRCYGLLWDEGLYNDLNPLFAIRVNIL
jgi:hypothetical protein